MKAVFVLSTNLLYNVLNAVLISSYLLKELAGPLWNINSEVHNVFYFEIFLKCVLLVKLNQNLFHINFSISNKEYYKLRVYKIRWELWVEKWMCCKAWIMVIYHPIHLWQCHNFSLSLLFQNTTMPYFHHFVAESVVNNKCCNYQQSANNNSKSYKSHVNTINHFSIVCIKEVKKMLIFVDSIIIIYFTRLTEKYLENKIKSN